MSRSLIPTATHADTTHSVKVYHRDSEWQEWGGRPSWASFEIEPGRVAVRIRVWALCDDVQPCVDVSGTVRAVNGRAAKWQVTRLLHRFTSKYPNAHRIEVERYNEGAQA